MRDRDNLDCKYSRGVSHVRREAVDLGNYNIISESTTPSYAHVETNREGSVVTKRSNLADALMKLEKRAPCESAMCSSQ